MPPITPITSLDKFHSVWPNLTLYNYTTDHIVAELEEEADILSEIFKRLKSIEVKKEKKPIKQIL